MSEAAGMWRIAPTVNAIHFARTRMASEKCCSMPTQRGANEMIIGLGGSATNDGGFGMARALGFRFLARESVEFNGPVSDLSGLEQIATGDLFLPQIMRLDVKNPLLGEWRDANIWSAERRDARSTRQCSKALSRDSPTSWPEIRVRFSERSGRGRGRWTGIWSDEFLRRDHSAGF